MQVVGIDKDGRFGVDETEPFAYAWGTSGIRSGAYGASDRGALATCIVLTIAVLVGGVVGDSPILMSIGALLVVIDLAWVWSRRSGRKSK
jgi:hypothetical protein